MPYDFKVDFSPIGDLGKVYREAQAQRAREQAFPQYGGDLGLAQLMLAHDREKFHQGIAERQIKLAETQAEEKPQYMKDDSGNIIEILPRGKGARVLSPTGAPAPTNPYAAGGKPPAEHEAKAGIFADRIASAHKVISENESINSGFGGAVSGVLSNTLPEGITTPLAGAGMLGGAPRQNIMNAQRSFINALLRRESGAAINAGEFASYSKEYFPQPGDGPEVIAQKRERRQQIAEGLMREAGKTYTPPKDFAGSKTNPSAPSWRTKENILAARANPQAEIQGARAAIAKGMPRDEAVQRLRAAGIDPSGL